MTYWYTMVQMIYPKKERHNKNLYTDTETKKKIIKSIMIYVWPSVFGQRVSFGITFMI